MKRVFALFLCGCLLFGSVACTEQTPDKGTTTTDTSSSVVTESTTVTTTTTTSTAAETTTTETTTTTKKSNPSTTTTTTKRTTTTERTTTTTALLPLFVFKTENITEIVFITGYGEGERLVVPPQHKEACTRWLGTFTVGEEVQRLLPPGTGFYEVEIYYSDGTAVANGLDTCVLDGVVYHLNSDSPPDCWWEILGIQEFLHND